MSESVKKHYECPETLVELQYVASAIQQLRMKIGEKNIYIQPPAKANKNKSS